MKAAVTLFIVALGGMLGCATADSASAPNASDAGAPAVDAGGDTNAAPMDAGPPDSNGSASADGSPGADAASPLPVNTIAVPCTDAIDDVYAPPTGLPPMTAAQRGDVVRCAADTTYSASDITTRLTSKNIPVTPTGGAALLRIAFRTQRASGADGASSARVYLPSVPKSLPLPVLVVAHPTVGLAAGCTPSMDDTSMEDLALPWVALGYAVVAPDYAGLGTPGVQGYVDNRDTAYSTLDGARAFRKLMSEGTFDDRVLVVGHSQGGGAALSAQALASTYGAGGRLVGVVVFAPEWESRLDSFGGIAMLRNPDALTVSTGISDSVVMVLRQYAYFANALGQDHATDSFPAAQQGGIGGAVQSLCQTPLGGYLQGADTHISDLIDDTLRTTLLACVDSNGATCEAPGLAYYQYLSQNIVTADPNGAPVLYVQGLLDEIMPIAREAACNIQKLEADGVTPQVCVDLSADHMGVVARNVVFAMQWAEAILGGAPAPSCSAFGMPACAP